MPGIALQVALKVQLVEEASMRIKILTGALVIAALVTLAISLGVATPNVYGGGDDTLPTLPEKPELKYPNLGSDLDQLVASVEKGETSAKEAAEDAPVHRGASVAVTIYLSGNVDDVVEFLEDNGGSPRNVGEDYIEAYVPVSLLGPTSEQPGVIRVREIIPPESAYGNFTSQGVQAHLSAAWNQAGYSGQGIKVGVIETGPFRGFGNLLGTELPVNVQARCYTDLGRYTQNLADCESGNDPSGKNYHGTIVAETIIDVAPEVSLYIANPRSAGDLRNAVDWMVAEGISIINHSAGWMFDGPGDRTYLYPLSLLNTVDRAVDGGAVWVNSAGNDARRTWFGPPSFLDLGEGIGVARFMGSDSSNAVILTAGDRVQIRLRWEDSWGNSSRDLNILVWSYSEQDYVALAADPQRGGPGHWPIELLTFEVPRDGEYGIVVSIDGLDDIPSWIQLIVSESQAGIEAIEHYTENGSILNPAESANPGLLAVGAAPWYDVYTIEPYSSRGPTPDGRVKPDIVGAACGETALTPLNENRRGFCGTSQAAPHVAGMAALVRQRFPTYTPVQVANYLKEHAEQWESPDPNNTWGHGFAKLPSLSECSDAVPNVARNPGLVADCEALLAARDTLAGSGTLNWSGSTAIGSWDGVTVDGSPQRVTKLNLRDSQLTGTIPPELGGLASLVELDLADNRLTGLIPSELSSLTNLKILSLTWNQLTGTIPPELSGLAGLETLALGGNRLTGPIPSELGSLTNLVGLDLRGNQLSGEIPSQLASLTNLQRLSLYDNQLTGTIPTWLGNLTNLERLYLSQNQLTGPIPSELGSLINLRGLLLHDNQLTGTIPTELGSLANLESLSLTRNQLTGTIPPELSGLTSLETLALGGNQLTGLGRVCKLWLGGKIYPISPFAHGHRPLFGAWQ